MEFQIDQEITLRQMSRNFAEDLYQLVSADFDAELCYWCPDLKLAYASPDSTLAHIDDANSKFANDKTPDFLIFYRSKLAGLISLSPIDKPKKSSEIGYWLGSNFVGKNIVTRIFPVVINYAKETLQLEAVELSTAAPNVRSQRLPEKFGFHQNAVIQNAEKLRDRTVDHILWRLEF